MTLEPGARFGPYDVVGRLGSGGMGEVYSAHDPRLGRDIAVKVLSAEASEELASLTRFEQEARAASALNHPNIITIHEIGRLGGIPYIAMELVAGKSVRELLSAGPIPMKKCLAIASQVAEGLSAAHEKGIVHRDLKPENVMVASEGFVKLLDFGLAKLAFPQSDSGRPGGQSLTRPGTVLGTVGYMSPEQASGREMDFRSDQFSFGALVYEMASGSRAFDKATPVETMTAILREEPPPLRAMNPEVPAPLAWVVERCLGKEPEERYASTRDLARDVQTIRGRLSEATESIARPALAGVSAAGRSWHGRGSSRLAGAFLSGVLVTLGIASWGGGRPSGTESLPLVRFDVPASKSGEYAYAGVPTLSPDGKSLAFTAEDAGRNSFVYVKSLDSGIGRRVAGTEGARGIFWSPDGSSIGFHTSEGNLSWVPAAGGKPQLICVAPYALGATWSREGVILVSNRKDGAIYRSKATGGDLERVTTPDPSRGERHVFPWFLPDGRRFLFLSVAITKTGVPSRNILAGSLDSSSVVSVTQSESPAQYAGAGALLFMQDGALVTAPFDEKGLKLTGPPASLGIEPALRRSFDFGMFSASRSGVLAFQGAYSLTQLTWVDRGGRMAGKLGSPRSYDVLRISPDGSRAAAAFSSRYGETDDLCILDLKRLAELRLTSKGGLDRGFAWSPDSSRVAYSTRWEGTQRVYAKAVDGLGADAPLLEKSGEWYIYDWSSDGRYLLYKEKVLNEMWAVPLSGGGNPLPVLKRPGHTEEARLSPDGRWMTFDSYETGKSQVYATPFPKPGGVAPVSTTGGTAARWRGDSKEVFYVDGRKVMAASVATGERLSIGNPRLLFEVSFDFDLFEVDPSGERFLFAAFEAAEPTPFTIVLGWRSLLSSASQAGLRSR